jgi:hypothetical protein
MESQTTGSRRKFLSTVAMTASGAIMLASPGRRELPACVWRGRYEIGGCHEPDKNGSAYDRIQGPKLVIEFSPKAWAVSDDARPYHVSCLH